MGTAETGTPHDALWAGVTTAGADNLSRRSRLCPNAASGSLYGMEARKDSQAVFDREEQDIIHESRSLGL